MRISRNPDQMLNINARLHVYRDRYILEINLLKHICTYVHESDLSLVHVSK